RPGLHPPGRRRLRPGHPETCLPSPLYAWERGVYFRPGPARRRRRGPDKEIRLMRRACTVGLGLAILGLGVCLLATSGIAGDEKKASWEPILPEAEFTKLLKHDVKILDDALKGDVDKKVVRKLKATALMLAGYAQGTKGKDAKELAGIRDTALQLLKALENE